VIKTVAELAREEGLEGLAQMVEELTSRSAIGVILSFNESTWWGEVELTPPSKGRIEFHATCFVGATTGGLPKIGDRVQVIYSDATKGRLLSVLSASK